MKRAVLMIACAFACTAAFSTERSSTARRDFAKDHPCPVTGAAVPDHCAGYVIDHVVPLCAGGPDKPANMQWSRKEISMVKDNVERATCYCLRKYGKDAGCPVVDWKKQLHTQKGDAK